MFLFINILNLAENLGDCGAQLNLCMRFDQKLFPVGMAFESFVWFNIPKDFGEMIGGQLDKRGLQGVHVT